ncbi:MAG: HAD family phosphatase [Candidatus Shapirobacteria bacterium]|jgi:HAD superfamily hydrolase (TIGR01549 family)
MSPKIKFVYFDIGNVFMTYDHVFQKVVKDFGLDSEELDRIYEPYDIDANLGKISIPEIWPILCQKLKISNGKDYDFIKSWVSDYQSIIPMHEFIKSIEGIYPLGIISNYYAGFYEECLIQGFIPKVNFTDVIISAEVGLMKPDAKIYELAEKRSGFHGDEILFIDDKDENTNIAKSLGWQTFCFDYHHPKDSITNLRHNHF